MRIIEQWQVGEYTIQKAEWRTSNGPDREIYGFLIGDQTRVNEWYSSLDMALIAAVGEKYTGQRGASGSNVGTAADWFARMIGMPAAD